MADLTDAEVVMLQFEEQWWKRSGNKAAAIRRRFGLTVADYYRQLDALVDRPEAAGAAPLVVRRLRAQRATHGWTVATPARGQAGWSIFRYGPVHNDPRGLAMRTRTLLICTATVVVLSGCSSDSDDEPSSDRGAQAIAEVTSLDGEGTAAEQDFVDELQQKMSRPYWDNGPEAMVKGYQLCVEQTPSASIFDLVDEGWSEKDAETFVQAAQKHLC